MPRVKKEVMYYKVQASVMQLFHDNDQMSAFRFYVYVQNHCSGFVHTWEFPEIRKDLGISDKVIAKNLKYLMEIGALSFFYEGIWRVNSWRKWATPDPKVKNRIIDIKLDQLRNIVFLRSLYYFRSVRCTHTRIRKNMKDSPDRQWVSPLKNSNEVKAPLSFSISASFVKAVTKIPESRNTILRQMKVLEKLGLIKIKTSFKILAVSDCYDSLKHKLHEYTTIIRRDMKFYLIRYRPHRITLC